MKHHLTQQAIQSAHGWNDIHDVWMYVSSDFRWVWVLLIITLVTGERGYVRGSRQR